RRNLNRYNDIFPWQYNRVKLKVPHGQEDYVNASLIDLPIYRNLPDFNVEKIPDRYIATQGPLDNTISDLWRMVVEQTQSPAVIVMLTETHDNGGSIARCADYFPLSPSEPKRQIVQGEESGDPFRAELLCEEVISVLDELVEMRRLVIKATSDEFVVWHLLYKNGEAFDQPEMKILEAMYTLMRLSEEKNLGPSNPRIVHCIAGTGRTGTYIALEHLIREVEEGAFWRYGSDPDPKEDLVAWVVQALREQRPNMIRNFQQYHFLYEVLRDLWKHKY
ncbi:phosphatases II, partial [Thozetella sp. PMI_491]